MTYTPEELEQIGEEVSKKLHQGLGIHELCVLTVRSGLRVEIEFWDGTSQLPRCICTTWTDSNVIEDDISEAEMFMISEMRLPLVERLDGITLKLKNGLGVRRMIRYELAGSEQSAKPKRTKKKRSKT
jgi:hypothetical protein